MAKNKHLTVLECCSVSGSKSAPDRITPTGVSAGFDCTIRGQCQNKPNCTTLCRSCKLCNSVLVTAMSDA